VSGEVFVVGCFRVLVGDWIMLEFLVVWVFVGVCVVGFGECLWGVVVIMDT
jgi:hypothetical protein